MARRGGTQAIKASGGDIFLDTINAESQNPRACSFSDPQNDQRMMLDDAGAFNAAREPARARFNERHVVRARRNFAA